MRRDAAGGAREDGLKHPRIAEGRDIALPLQALLVGVHGQRDVDGEDQLEIDGKRFRIRMPRADELDRMGRLVEAKLADYNVQAKVVGVYPGPVITRFELDLAPGMKASSERAKSIRRRPSSAISPLPSPAPMAKGPKRSFSMPATAAASRAIRPRSLRGWPNM